MAGRHLAPSGGRGEAADYPAGIPNGGDSGDRRHEHLVDPGARISDGTAVTVDMEAMPTHPEVAASEADPEALVERGRVGDGHELE